MTSAVDDLRSRIAASVRQLVGGDEEPPGAPSDGGLFGAGSATWVVHGDASMFVGGIRALLLQSLHPPTMAGVADHSNYKTDPLGRLQRTGKFLAATTYGSVAEAEAAIETVRRIHDGVTGLTLDGRPYRANDPHLLAWVHATEVESFLVAKQRFGTGAVDDATADAYVAEMAEVARRFGVADPPTSRAELRQELESYRPELGLNRQSRQALWFITFPPLPLHMRAPYAVLYAGAVSTLPRWARRLLWVPRLPVTETLAVRPAAATVTRLLDWSLTSGRPADL